MTGLLRPTFTVQAPVAILDTFHLMAQQPAVDLVLTDGKIVTVDDEFAIAQAFAVRGDTIVAVGSTQRIAQLSGPATERIDLHRKTVILSLVDNHVHLPRAGATWTHAARSDGVESLATGVVEGGMAAARPIAAKMPRVSDVGDEFK